MLSILPISTPLKVWTWDCKDKRIDDRIVHRGRGGDRLPDASQQRAEPIDGRIPGVQTFKGLDTRYTSVNRLRPLL